MKIRFNRDFALTHELTNNQAYFLSRWVSASLPIVWNHKTYTFQPEPLLRQSHPVR